MDNALAAFWGSTDSSGAAWLQTTIGLAAYGGNANVKFRFRGVSGTSFTGDMAIDDFLVENLLPDNAGITAMLNPLPGSAAGWSSRCRANKLWLK